MHTQRSSSAVFGSIEEQQRTAITKFLQEYCSRYELEDDERPKTKAPSSSSYVPALTGVRGIAALLVIFSHFRSNF